MKTIKTLDQWRILRKRHALTQQRIGFVPTMGHLHAGHLSLLAQAASTCDITVLSIFVNPTQFNQTEDFAKYPRTLAQDQALAATQKVDYLLVPEVSAMYPYENGITLHESELSLQQEGHARPGHFSGMLTIVLKLLNLVMPDKLFMGEKDYQQYLLVKKMVDDLFLPVDVVPCSTCRASSGLALSSRNSRLTQAQQTQAAQFYQALCMKISDESVAQHLTALGFKVDYIETTQNRRYGAVWLDEVRLIDNVRIDMNL